MKQNRSIVLNSAIITLYLHIQNIIKLKKDKLFGKEKKILIYFLIT